jgi:hypothetical protein
MKDDQIQLQAETISKMRKSLLKLLVKAEYMTTIEIPIPLERIEWYIRFLNGMINWSYNHTYITQKQFEKLDEVRILFKSIELPETEAPF